MTPPTWGLHATRAPFPVNFLFFTGNSVRRLNSSTAGVREAGGMQVASCKHRDANRRLQRNERHCFPLFLTMKNTHQHVWAAHSG
jgi:hypothetical protein